MKNADMTATDSVKAVLVLHTTLEDEKPRLGHTSCDCGALRKEVKALKFKLLSMTHLAAYSIAHIPEGDCRDACEGTLDWLKSQP